jgi:flagellar biosynthesis protein
MRMSEIKKAVALKYDMDDKEGAPRIIAVGKGNIAEKIIEIANKEKVPIVENQEIVAKLVQFPVGLEIPQEFYEAIAKILVYIYKLDQENGARKL